MGIKKLSNFPKFKANNIDHNIIARKNDLGYRFVLCHPFLFSSNKDQQVRQLDVLKHQLRTDAMCKSLIDEVYLMCEGRRNNVLIKELGKYSSAKIIFSDSVKVKDMKSIQ